MGRIFEVPSEKVRINYVCFDIFSDYLTNMQKSSWCVPSFDCAPTNKPGTKRTSSVALDNDVLEDSHVQNRSQQRKHETSLSKLLEACEPKQPSDLAVSKQKQKDISNWLQYRALKGQPSMLVLSGPSGCSKTATMKLLARKYGFDIIEWITPVDPAEDENGRIMRQGDRFEDHLIRATRYHTVFGTGSRQLLLVKDLPNVYHTNQEYFFKLLEKYFEIGREPVIFVFTETNNSRLLNALSTSDIKEKFNIDLIKVPAVTMTAMKKVMTRVCGVLNSIAGDMLHVSQKQIDETLSNDIGDVRSATLNLIFLSLKVPEQRSKNECGMREETLSLLHGVGRVLYPKRDPNSNSGKFVHNPDEIAGFFQSQMLVFVKFLQENYLNNIRTLEEATVASDILSLTNVLNSDWQDSNLGIVAFSYCIRGLMLANEKPLSVWNPVRKSQDDNNKGDNNKFTRKQCLATAEKEWYKSIIKPASEEPNIEVDIEMLDIDMFIEDD